jgi:hypothetical protein
MLPIWAVKVSIRVPDSTKTHSREARCNPSPMAPQLFPCVTHVLPAHDSHPPMRNYSHTRYSSCPACYSLSPACCSSSLVNLSSCSTLHDGFPPPLIQQPLCLLLLVCCAAPLLLSLLAGSPSWYDVLLLCLCTWSLGQGYVAMDGVEINSHKSPTSP